MNAPEEAWELLACPACGGELSREEFVKDSEGVLICAACDEWYPVTRGVPRLIAAGPLRPDDGEFLSRWSDRLGGRVSRAGASCPGEMRSVQSAFSFKWSRLPDWGLEGESAAFMSEWLLDRYGWSAPGSLEAFLSGRRRVLDAGCGLGRETIRMASAGAELVVGMDLSEAVDHAADHARRRGIANVLFIQADLMHPPFCKGAFDFILSEGVLHHTPDTRAAFRSLCRLLTPAGEVAFYVYRRKAPLREFADDHVRERLKDRTPEEAWKLMEPLTRLGKSLHDLGVSIEVSEPIEVLGIPAGSQDLQRLVYYHLFKCFWSDRMSFDENVLVNFDWYYPRYAWRHDENEVRDWIREERLEMTHERIEESGITVRARRANA